jgi:hypothetical protein
MRTPIIGFSSSDLEICLSRPCSHQNARGSQQNLQTAKIIHYPVDGVDGVLSLASAWPSAHRRKGIRLCEHSRKQTQPSLMDNESSTTIYAHTQHLTGKTPAEAAGIKLQLESNKWEAMIKQASSTSSSTREKQCKNPNATNDIKGDCDR